MGRKPNQGFGKRWLPDRYLHGDASLINNDTADP